MNAHIVLWEDGHIIPRMARHIAGRNGWTISDRPDNSVDLNYFMPYLQAGKIDQWPDTPTAAWFTHYERGTPWKERIWHHAAARVDLRLTVAPGEVDGLLAHGETVLLPPAYDADHFILLGGSPAPNNPSLLGLSGVGQPRKGPELVRRLMEEGIGRPVNVAATGEGWPIQSNALPYNALPGVYARFDVLLCTSLIEGIPAPPFEALGVGTKVVIPHGVGALDVLPEMPGIRRYRRGNFDDMRRAIGLCLDDDADPATLAAQVELFTLDNWADRTAATLAGIKAVAYA